MQEHSFACAKDKVVEGAQEFKDAIKETAQNKVDTYMETCTDYIKDQPYKSLAIAFGAGALFGLIMLRR